MTDTTKIAADVHQLDGFGRDVGCPRLTGELHSAYAERLIEHVSKMIDEADLRIIDLEQIRDIASTYGRRDND